MGTNFTVKAYYTFMFMLPLLFYSGVADMTLLPRQLFLSVFTLLLTVYIWKIAKKDTISFKIDTANLALLLYFLLAAVISLINATVLSETWYGLSKLWLIVSLSILTGLLLRQHIISSKQIVTSVIIFGCVAIGTALTDIIGKTLHGEFLLRDVNFITGGFANKNLLSSILFLCLPFFTIGMREKRFIKIISCIALCLTLLILAILRTRIVLIATFIFFGIMAFFYIKDFFKRKFWLFVGVFFSIAAVFFFTLRSNGIFGKLDLSSNSIKHYFYRVLSTDTLSERIKFWQNSIEMFREYPFGVGLGNWQIYFPKYGLDKFNSFGILNGTSTLQRPHNDFLGSLCETGVIGFAVFVCVFIIIIFKSFRLIKTATDQYEKWFSIALFSGLIGFTTIAFFDFPMERIEHLVLLMMLFALVIHQHATKNKSGFSIPVKKKFVLIFILVGISVSSVITYCRFAGEKDVFKMYAAKTNENNDDMLSFAEHAENFSYKIDTRTIPLEWYQGVAKFSKQQYIESEICFQNAYALTPYNIHVLNNLASCYEINGKRKEAITTYLKALQISPRFEEARLNLAAVYFNNKEYDKAFNTIDFCSIQTQDPKYKIFLPPILKNKVNLIIKGIKFPILPENINKLINMRDYSQLYFESKKNNITFEQQIINHLNK